MKIEIWKDIPGYEGRYQVSTEGRIRSLDRRVPCKCHYAGKLFYRTVKGKILSPGRYCKAGHLSVVLGHGTAGRPVHRNGDPTDNRLENLHYGTRLENILDVYRQGGKWKKLSVDDVQAIRFGFCCGIKGVELAAMYDVTPTIISAIKTGRNFAWLK